MSGERFSSHNKLTYSRYFPEDVPEELQGDWSIGLYHFSASSRVPRNFENPVFSHHWSMAEGKRMRDAMRVRDLGVKFFCQSEYETSLRYLSQSLELNPTYSNPLMFKGLIYHKLGQYQDEIQCYAQARGLVSNDGLLYSLQANALTYLQRFDEAMSLSNRAIELDTRQYCVRGKCLHSMKRYEEALICLNQAIDIVPTASLAYGYKANILLKLDRFEEAIYCADSVIKFSSRDPQLYLDKGKALYSLGQYQESINMLNKSIKFNPCTSKPSHDRDDQLYDRFEDAIISFDKLIDNNSNFVDAYLTKGKCFHNLLRFENALVCFDKALQRDSNNDSLFFWKGQTLHQLERFADAISCFDRAIELNSQNEAAYLQKMGSLQLLQLDHFDPYLL